eukprot:TRINITY_DN16378_c0_g1_i1.p1 TRINITY_DN16378_c0_g1~~TRINITY_DN16378_c0_g1_i1.p1  ORF type:complete len:327 (-),score=65.67 TRINITY_DN16378_c0_g1_i1:190-1170(-)
MEPNILIIQVIGLIVLGGGSLLSGLVPICLKGKGQKLSTGSVLSCLACYGGGVILATCFTHMMPEVHKFLKFNFDHHQLPASLGNLPLAEIFILVGFFLIYIIEEVTHSLMGLCTSGMNGHSHGFPEAEQMLETSDMRKEQESEEKFVSAMRGFLVVLALSLHEMFEGIALGLATTERGVWLLLLAIGSHKFIIALCLGQQLVTSKVHWGLIVLYISTFSLTTVIGAGAGMAMLHSASTEEDAHSVSVTVMQGIATGSLLYVVFFEVIEKERATKTSQLLQLVFILLGSSTIIILKVVEDIMAGGKDLELERVTVNGLNITMLEAP